MGAMGMLDLTQFRNDLQDVVNEASDMAKSLYQSVLNLLKDNIDILRKKKKKLLEKETLVESEIDEIVYK